MLSSTSTYIIWDLFKINILNCISLFAIFLNVWLVMKRNSKLSHNDRYHQSIYICTNSSRHTAIQVFPHEPEPIAPPLSRIHLRALAQALSRPPSGPSPRSLEPCTSSCSDPQYVTPTLHLHFGGSTCTTTFPSCDAHWTLSIVPEMYMQKTCNFILFLYIRK